MRNLLLRYSCTSFAQLLVCDTAQHCLWICCGRCVRRLMAETRPGLVLDLHEYDGDGFWMSARHQHSPDDEAYEQLIAAAVSDLMAALGTPLHDTSEMGEHFEEAESKGVVWLSPGKRGEGMNLADFAAAEYGQAFTLETGMRQRFGRRVELHKKAAQTAVRAWEERFA